MIELISTPYKNRTEDTGSQLPVKWLMANNPLYYNFQRKDGGVYRTGKHSTSSKTFMYLDAIYDGLEVGDIITVYGNEGIDDGDYEILVVGYSSTFNKTWVIVDNDYEYSPTLYYGGYANWKENYYITIQLYDYNSGTVFSTAFTDADLLTELKVRPNNNGQAKVDISGFVKNLFSFGNDFDYSSVNDKDDYSTKKFALYVKENFLDSEEEIIYIDVFNVVNGAKQIGDKYGAALPDYIYDPNRDLTEKSKFLTLYKPRYFDGYPFSISFINVGLGDVAEIQEGLSAKLIKRETVAGVDTNTELTVFGNSSKVNHLMLTGSYSVNKISILLRQDGTIYNDLSYVEPEYVDAGYVDADVSDTLADILLSESLEVNINQECIENPLYFRWYNQLGGWSYWLFSNNYLTKSRIFEAELFNPTIEDILTATGTIEYLQRESENSIVIGAENVIHNDKQLISTMIMSRKIQMYDEDNETWRDVQVVPGSFDIVEAKETRSSIELEIKLPKTYLQ